MSNLKPFAVWLPLALAVLTGFFWLGSVAAQVSQNTQDLLIQKPLTERLIILEEKASQQTLTLNRIDDNINWIIHQMVLDKANK